MWRRQHGHSHGRKLGAAGDTAYDQTAPVLEYGTSWSRGGFTCVSMTNGVECRNKENHGFLLSRETWTQF